MFIEVLMICDELDLIGRNMFAIDGCKMPSNASKDWRGTKAELRRKMHKMEKAVRKVYGSNLCLTKANPIKGQTEI